MWIESGLIHCFLFGFFNFGDSLLRYEVVWQGVRCFFGSNEEDGVSSWGVGFVWIGWRFVYF